MFLLTKFIKLVLTLYITQISFGFAQQRIVGGNAASITQFPYIASIRSSRDAHFCGGSIISSRFILTAAHCVSPLRTWPIYISLGTSRSDEKGVQYSAKKVYVHPGFATPLQSLFSNDIALLSLTTTITFSSQIQPIKLNSAYFSEPASAVLAGWGRPSALGSTTKQLKFLEYNTISLLSCRFRMLFLIVPNSEICAVSADENGACFGDSGGPLTANGIQIGVISRVIPCGRGFPDLFVRVSNYYSWIKQIVN